VSVGTQKTPRAHAHVMEPIERAIRWILLCGIALSVALMAAGLVLGVAQGTGLPRGVVPLAELPGGLAALRPAAYLSLGLIVLIGTPFVRVAGSLVIFVRARDGRYVLVTAIVLFVMCLGVALGRI
jgi:uncharacterized membrane protein